MNEKNNNRGFAGLSKLTSEISIQPEDTIATTQTASSESANTDQPKGHNDNSLPSPEAKSAQVTEGFKIIIGVAFAIFIFFVLFIFVFMGKNNWKPSNTSIYSPRTNNSVVNNSPIKDIHFEKPPAETTTNNINDRPSTELTREAQKLLRELGYSPGPIDGIFGQKTAAALSSFQKDVGLVQNGYLDESLLDALKKRKVNQEHLAPKTTGYNISPSIPVVQPLPRSGEVRMFTKKTCIAPFEIKSLSGSHYLLKLVDIFSGSAVLNVFVRSSSNVTIDVPLGTYEIRYAAGETWYGYEKLFGPDTAYSKADETFTFERVGNQITGFTITLYKVVNGNLSTSPIDASSF